MEPCLNFWFKKAYQQKLLKYFATKKQIKIYWSVSLGKNKNKVQLHRPHKVLIFPLVRHLLNAAGCFKGGEWNHYLTWKPAFESRVPRCKLCPVQKLQVVQWPLRQRDHWLSPIEEIWDVAVGGGRRAHRPAAYICIMQPTRLTKSKTRMCQGPSSVPRISFLYRRRPALLASHDKYKAGVMSAGPTGGSIARFPLERRRHRAHPRCTSVLC